MSLVRPLLLSFALILVGCAGSPAPSGGLRLTDQDRCPISLSNGQTLTLSLPSNPSTGYRWELREAASHVLKSLGPEVYSNPHSDELVGTEGLSTWRFQAIAQGEGHLSLSYQRPWEGEPAGSFECLLQVQ